jgi:hypothetical protein
VSKKNQAAEEHKQLNEGWVVRQKRLSPFFMCAQMSSDAFSYASAKKRQIKTSRTKLSLQRSAGCAPAGAESLKQALVFSFVTDS